MELRHIRYFLAVAEEGNFTRAAARVGIGQPPLSQQIRDLENEIGAQLFHRVPHGAELTAAGLAFRERVAMLPAAAEQAAEAARRAARGELGTLRLGFTGTAAINPVVPRLIRDFRRERPDLSLELFEANSVRLREDVLGGRLDAAILRPGPADPPDLVTQPLASEPLVIALPVDQDRSPDEAEIPLAGLAALPLILTPREVGISLHDAAVAACRNAGFDPQLGPPAPQIASILSLVAAGQGFSLVPESMRQLTLEGLVYKSVSGGVADVEIGVATARGMKAPAVAAFLRKAREMQHPGSASS